MATVNIDLRKNVLPIYYSTVFSMKKYQVLKGGRSTAKTSRHVFRICMESYTTPKLISFAVARAEGKLDTGIVSEFKKVSERMGLKQGRLSKGACVEGDFVIRQKPKSLIFKNGSVVHFEGSKNWEDLKGRSTGARDERFGFLFLDEFADYDEKVGMSIVSGLANTFLRDDYGGENNHFVWGSGEDLDLSEAILDENGEVIFEEDVHGVLQPQLKKGTDTFGCKMLISTNPPKNREHWFFDWCREYLDREDVWHMHVNYNTEFINPSTKLRDSMVNSLVKIGMIEIVTEAESMKEHNYIRYRHEFLGEPTSVSGLYFNTFDKDKLRVNRLPDTFDAFCIGADFGTSDATTFVMLGLKETKIYILDAYYHGNGDGATQKAPSDYARDLIDFAEDNARKWNCGLRIPVFYDHSARGFKDEVEKMLKKSFNKSVNMKKATKERKPTLNFLFDLITQGDLNYLTSLRNILIMEAEIRKAETHPTKDDMAKGNDHLIDALRYGCYGLKIKMYKNYRK